MEALKLLPVEPNEAMIEAGGEEIASRRSLGCAIYASDIYEAMVGAYEPDPNPRPAAQPGVVKGLEWIEAEGNYPGQTVWSPKNDIWPCWIVKNLNSDSYIWCEEIGIELAPASPVMGGFQSLDAAKAAAQADYERRILSQIDFAALADPVSQEPVAWQSKLGPKGEWANDPLGFDPVLRAKSEAAGAQWRPLYASPQPLTEGEPSEAKRLLDTLREESWDLRCFDVPTGGGDADIGWRIVGHWQAQPCERVIAEVYHDDPQAAIRAALLAATSKGGQADG